MSGQEREARAMSSARTRAAQDQARVEGRDPDKLCIFCGGTGSRYSRETGRALHTGILSPTGALNGCNMCLGTQIDGTHPPLRDTEQEHER